MSPPRCPLVLLTKKRGARFHPKLETSAEGSRLRLRTNAKSVRWRWRRPISRVGYTSIFI